MAGFSKEARSRARELALQAIYQAQIAQHDTDELLRQFHERPDYEHVDRDYFDEVLTAVSGRADELARLEFEHSALEIFTNRSFCGSQVWSNSMVSLLR